MMRKNGELSVLPMVPVVLVMMAQQLLAGEALVLSSAGQADSWIESSGEEVGEMLDYEPMARRRWYFRSEGLALKRYTPETQVFTGLNVDEPHDPLTTGDLEYEFQGGYRLALGRMLGDWYSLEFTYFDVNDWYETAAIRNTEQNQLGSYGILMSPFTNFGDPTAVMGVDYNMFVNIESWSEMNNMELNLWKELPMPPDSMAVSYLIGLRYMDILEQFRYFSYSGVPTPLGSSNMVNTRCGNSLLGVQLGALFEFPVDPGWWIDWELKGAICHNRADQHTRYVNITEDVETIVSGERKESRTVFVGETSVRLVYEFSPRLMAYAGYQAIWVDGLALASENLIVSLPLLRNGPAQLDHNGNLVYHGPHVGLTLIW